MPVLRAALQVPSNLPAVATTITTTHSRMSLVCNASARMRRPVIAKNSGSSRVAANGSTLATSSSRSWALDDTATPAANAPNSAWMPSTSVTSALASDSSRMPSSQRPSRPRTIFWRANHGFTAPSISAMNSTTQTRFTLAVSQPVACAAATISASMHHAVASPSAAQAMEVCPSGVYVMPRSARMRSSTGKAVMLMEIPTNSAKAVKPTPCGPCPGYSQMASPTPSTKGTAMPAWLTVKANLRRPRSAPRSSSAPATSRNISTPSWLSMPSGPSDAAGNNAPCSCGSRLPRTSGPIIRPAAISPITAGWPKCFSSAPAPLATSSSTSSCSRNRPSGDARWWAQSLPTTASALAATDGTAGPA